MEFKGGTYVSQVRALNQKDAPATWALALNAHCIHGFGAKSSEKLASMIKNEAPVSLDGLKDAWCMSLRLRGSLMLVNFFKTSS
jgi:hypothetical protein